MKGYTLKRLLNVLDAEPENFEDSFLAGNVNGISTDSRNVRKGDVFFAIHGDRYDGAAFVDNAFDAGAILSVVNSDSVKGKTFTSPVVPVEDPVHALGDVAADYRSDFTGKVIAVTGSNGKTTVREMILAVLRTGYIVHGSKKNFNNQIGLPLSIFGLEKRHDCAVFELGMSAPGEIAYLSKITRPDIGVILNVGHGHIEFFSGLEEIALAKMELLDSIGSEGIVIINGDDELLKPCEGRSAAKVVRFGINTPCDYRAENIVMQPDVCARFEVEGQSIKLKVPGFHNIYNALAAYTVGRMLNVDQGKAAKALGEFEAPNMRMQCFEKQGICFINDSYNANPLSMKAAADVLKNIKGERKIAVLGDMLELGNISEESHFTIGKLFAGIGLECLCLVGKNADIYYRGAREGGMKPESVEIFADIDLAIDFIKSFIRTGDVLLAKGSRALGMEKIIDVVSEAV